MNRKTNTLLKAVRHDAVTGYAFRNTASVASKSRVTERREGLGIRHSTYRQKSAARVSINTRNVRLLFARFTYTAVPYFYTAVPYFICRLGPGFRAILGSDRFLLTSHITQ